LKRIDVFELFMLDLSRTSSVPDSKLTLYQVVISKDVWSSLKLIIYLKINFLHIEKELKMYRNMVTITEC